MKPAQILDDKTIAAKVREARASGRELWLKDGKQDGLALRVRSVKKSDRKGVDARWYFGQYVSPTTKKRTKFPFAKLNGISLEEARETARLYSVILSRGIDPQEHKAGEDAKALTFEEVAELYLKDFAMRVDGNASTGRKSTLVEFTRVFEKTLYPALGKLPLLSVTPDHVRRLHVSLKEKPAVANKVLKLISVVYHFAAKEGLGEISNSARYIGSYRKETGRRAFASGELERLGTVLQEAENEGVSETAILAIRLIALTGFRRGEIVGQVEVKRREEQEGLRFNQIDFEKGTVTLPRTKTGKQVRVIGAAALKLIREEFERRFPDSKNTDPVIGEFCVCPSRYNPWLPFVGLPLIARELLNRAHIKLCIHELRHTFASVGASLETGRFRGQVGSLLGHSYVRQEGITSLYTHVPPEVLRPAADAISSHIAQLLGLEDSAESAKVLPFNRHSEESPKEAALS